MAHLGGTNANLKYAPLDQINVENVGPLRIAWRQSAMPVEVRQGRGTVNGPTNHQVTPLMVEGKQYIVVATGWKNTPGELIAMSLP